ncbi:MAG: S8 family serine peptidase [candidate division Zixibacteria bacterium]|nr:S8 family serine peptidase [candidate division Zixibacteria bacterium]
MRKIIDKTCLGIVLITIFSLCLLLPAIGHANAPEDPVVQEELYQPGMVLIQLSSSAINSIGYTMRSGAQSATQTGLVDVDVLLQAQGLAEVSLPSVQPANIELAAQMGLDRRIRCKVSTSTDIESLASDLVLLADVESASPNWRLDLMTVPNDPLYPLQWGHDNQGQMNDCGCDCTGIGTKYCCEHENGSPVGSIGSDADVDMAWTAMGSFGDENIIIAILDTGTDPHIDLRLVPGWNVADNNSNTSDIRGHGTATAGITAAIADNNRGVAGVAGGCSVMPVRVMSQSGGLFASYIADGMIYAADNGAHVISMSVGGPYSSEFDFASNYAYNSGVSLFASAGNSNCNGLSYPAGCTNVIAVGAASPCGERKRSSSIVSCLSGGVCADNLSTSCDGEHWWGSTYGSGLDIIAPTILPTTARSETLERIIPSGPEEHYSMWFNGTSCSCPFAAGIAGLLLSIDPSLTPAQVKQLIIDGANDVTTGHATVGYDIYTGYGMVNAFNSVIALALDTDEDGILDDGDFSGDPNDNPCTGGVIANCDDNCVDDYNPNQEDTDWDGIGDECDSCPGSPHQCGSCYIPHIPGDVNMDGDVDILDIVYLINFKYKDGPPPEPYEIEGDFNCDTLVNIIDITILIDYKYKGGAAPQDCCPQSVLLEPTPIFLKVKLAIIEASITEKYDGNTTTIMLNSEIDLQGLELRINCDEGATITNLTPDLQLFASETDGQRQIGLLDTKNNGYLATGLNSVIKVTGKAQITEAIGVNKEGTGVGIKIKNAEKEAMLPTAFALHDCYPNPFNPVTTISYDLQDAVNVKLVVYNVIGQRVATLVNEYQAAGSYQVDWNSRNKSGQTVASGIYVYRLTAGEFVETKRMMLLK